MKKNWMQIVTLVLCAVLLAVTIVQGRKLEELRGYLDIELSKLENHMDSAISNVDDQVALLLEEAANPIEDFEVEPLYVDKENQTLEANIVLTLKQWSEDTMVDVTAIVGRNTFITRLPINGNGICSGQMAFPLEEQTEVRLEAAVITNGITTRQELTAWTDISGLLPLWNGGGGWSGPYWEGGLLTCDHMEIDICDRDNRSVEVMDPRYHVYCNSELVQELPGKYQTDMQIPCQDGDTIEVHFLCKDEFGLNYEFYFLGWRIRDGIAEDYYADGWESPKLSWD